jgi:Gas vesicle synthesis protein GvpL/GvpF
VIELYAITDHPTRPLPDVAPLWLVPSGDLAAVCAPAGDGEVSADELWRHEEVVEALMADRDLLPVRYGTRLEDDAAAAHAIAARRDALATALDRVRGAVELSLRVVPADAHAALGAAASGTEYLRERARAAGALDRVATAVHEPLAALARASTSRTIDPVELRAAYLVDRDAVEAFADRVAALQSEHPELRLLCTGPWPPYSFAEA